MVKILQKLLVCLGHMLSVILAEACLEVSIIWFWDYGYSLNGWIAIGLAVALALHCCLLILLTRRKVTNKGTRQVLLWFDSVICVSAVLACMAVCLFFAKMPYGQVIFAVVINIAILLVRLGVTRYLKKMDGLQNEEKS